MTKPNFFIIGAPKCGTTSVAHWLSEHPSVYMSHIKEPNYFNTDDNRSVTRTLQQYETLFSQVRPQHIAIGEASAWYLYSRTAVPNIRAYVEDSRFIVMLRNPVEMAYSLHQQEIFSGNEYVTDFPTAWSLQEKRIADLGIASTPEPRRLLYGDACKLGEQLARLYDHVERERVLVLLLDDVKSNARKEYLKMMKFLAITDDGRSDFPVENSAKGHRYRALAGPVSAMRRVVRQSKLALGVHGRFGIFKKILKANTISHPRQPLDGETKKMLSDYFRDDITRLSELLERDLTYWLSAPP